jgi:ankyrin repeat protein
VAIRPLGVDELAEVLAVDFGDAEGIPKLKLNWRWEDQEQALLTSCSGLIAIVDTGRSRVVQFSHFSVKEYLTSTRLATSSGDFSRYHVDLEPAHTILAQACMGILLQADDHAEQNDVEENSPLAKYAAEHWVTHAQFQRVSPLLRKAMEYLFDSDKPYFMAWLQLHDIDNYPERESSSFTLHRHTVRSRSGATPLYYAALCGFQDVVEHLVIKYPQHVNTRGGYFMTPLMAALARRHFQTAELLRHNGAHVDVRGKMRRTPLHSAAWYGDLEMVRVLLNYKADVNARGEEGWTPIHFVSQGHQGTVILNIDQSLRDVARLLLEHGADVNAQISGSDSSGRTPLHVTMEFHTVEVVRVLLEHGANVGAEDSQGRTPLHEAMRFNKAEVVRVLLEHGANVDAEDSQGRTPLHEAIDFDKAEVVRMLLKHGANVDTKDGQGRTPFQIASAEGYDEIMKMLSEHGAK